MALKRVVRFIVDMKRSYQIAKQCLQLLSVNASAAVISCWQQERERRKCVKEFNIDVIMVSGHNLDRKPFHTQ